MNDDSTSIEIKQQLSAFMDGELDSQRARFLLSRLAGDPPLQASWSRWHAARACLRRESTGPLRADFASAIATALAADNVPRRAMGQVLRWAGGLAVAASVAVAALLAVPLNQAPIAPAPTSTALASQPAAQPAALVAASSLTERDLRPNLDRVTQTVARSGDGRSLTPALRIDPQLASYLLRHKAAVRGNGDATYLPFVQVAAPVRPWSMLPATVNETAPR